MTTATPLGIGMGGVLAAPGTAPTTTTTTTTTTATVPASAEAPVWQPWVQVQANALSVLKTGITKALAEYNRAGMNAQTILDQAVALAKSQSAPLETAAWAAFNKYMGEAGALSDAILSPANTAYTAAMDAAHTRLLAELDPIQHAYARVASDTGWTHQLATGGATIGSG